MEATVIAVPPGRVVVAPGGYQPSIDVTLTFVAIRFCLDARVVVLAGIGCTIAQDETTSVVFGMPKTAMVGKKNGMPGRQAHTVL